MSRIITNNFGLPEPIVKAVQYDTHKTWGDVSCSQLIDAPKIRMLKLQNDYEEDVANMLEALMGTAMHNIIERATMDNVRKNAFVLTMETLLAKHKDLKDPVKKEGIIKVIEYLKKYSDMVLKTDDRYMTEKTLRYEVDGIILYGTLDMYDTLTKTIEDYKSCKVYAWTYPESRKKWVQQLNVYAYLLMMNGYEVNNLVINAFFKDWSGANAFHQKDYPKQKIMRIPVKLGTPEQITAFVHERIKLHKQAIAGDIPLCTGSERWAKADEFAVKAAGAKRALKRFDDKDMANTWIRENGHKHKNPYVEDRPGDSQRCAEYCSVAKFCEQRKQELVKQQQMADEK